MRKVRVLDLDGSLSSQASVFPGQGTAWTTARDWGPAIRLACSFRTYSSFRRWLSRALSDAAPGITFYGSGDFHHVTLALLERIPGPFNLLVLDKHPDWMRGIPFLHCGTWLRHALKLGNLNRVFHCGGELDFDNFYRRLAPWPDLQSSRVVVFPARRHFTRGRWAGIVTLPLLTDAGPIDVVLREALQPFLQDLARIPLYISVDKDVLSAEDAAVNWDSGLLRLPEAVMILETFLAAAEGHLAGADVLGDWSAVELGHWLNRLCDRIDHPSPHFNGADAAARNQRANTKILGALCAGSRSRDCLRGNRS